MSKTIDEGIGSNIGAVINGQVHNLKFQVTKGMTDGEQTAVDFIILDYDVDLKDKNVYKYSGDLNSEDMTFEMGKSAGPTPMIAISHGTTYYEPEEVKTYDENGNEIIDAEVIEPEADSEEVEEYSLDEIEEVEGSSIEPVEEEQEENTELEVVENEEEIPQAVEINNTQENCNTVDGWNVFMQLPVFDNEDDFSEYFNQLFRIFRMCIKDTTETDMKPEFPEIDDEEEDKVYTKKFTTQEEKEFEIFKDHEKFQVNISHGMTDGVYTFLHVSLLQEQGAHKKYFNYPDGDIPEEYMQMTTTYLRLFYGKDIDFNGTTTEYDLSITGTLPEYEDHTREEVCNEYRKIIYKLAKEANEEDPNPMDINFPEE